MKRANWVRPLLLLLFLLNASTVLDQHASLAVDASGPQQSSPSQTSPSPCLTPSPADKTTTQLQATTTNATLTGNVLPDVKSGRAQFKHAFNQARPLNTEMVLKLRNADQFQKCLDAITDPTSPYYGQFLNANTLEPYLPTPGQKVSIIQYLTRHGFNVTSGPSPLVLNVAGSVSVIQRVFGLKLGIYQRNTNSSFYAADSDPTMPQNLAAFVNGITGLENYTTIKPSESPCSGPYCPQGIQVGYSLPSLTNNNGAGQAVAIIDAPGDPNPCCGASSALHVYDLQYGIQDPNPSTFQVLCGSTSTWTTSLCSSVTYDPSWGSEAAMDIEAVHAVAPGAGILLFYGISDLLNAIDYVAQNHLASIASNSWTYDCFYGSCSDTQLPSSLVSSTDSRLATDTAQGLTILFASGDQGARPNGSTLGTEFPASDPNVLAIGATNLVLAGCGTTCTGYASETGALVSGGGYSGHFLEPSWQTANIGPQSGRAVPDVSMLGLNPGFWVYSTASDKCLSGGNSAGWFYCAGTSLSTPLWAGFLAIALQMRGGGEFGNIGPKLYGIAHSGAYSTAFHDITIGSNNGYSASLGWDPVTGWGSPIANVLAADLAQGKVAISLSPTSGGIGTLVSITGSNFLFTDTTCAISSVPSGLLSGPTCSITNGAVTASFTVATVLIAQSYTVSVTGSPGSDFASTTFTVTSTQVTVTSNPQGSGFVVVDNVAITTPTTYSWVTGSTHSISANSPASGSTGIRYVFTSWSDSGAITHTITVPSSTASYTANYKTQFQLTIAGNPSGGGSTNPPVGSYWYDSGASPQISQTASVGYSFFYWSLDGTNVAATPTFTVLMNAPHTLTALFRGSSTISMTLSSNSIALSTGVTISGTLTPTQSSPGIPAGAIIVLSYSLGGGYSPFITTTTASGGGYSVSWIPPYPGSYSLQASWGGDANYVGSAISVSPLTVSGTVTPQPQLLITGPASASRGTTASFTVLITNPTATTLTTTLYVEIIGPNGYYYFDSQQATVSASASSRFQFDWQVPATISTGSYVVNVGLIPPTSSSISQTQITIN